MFASARSVTRYTAELVRAPRRIRPSEAAAQYVRDNNGAWRADQVPELLEPLDLLGSRDYTGIVFVGPARTGKTYGLILAGIGYVVTSAPGDMLIVQMSQDTARDFSRKELDRVIRYSPEIASRLSPRAKDDNTFDKFWRSGMVLKLGWPAASQLASKTLRYVFFTDYERPENRDDVGGEGPMWDQGAKRIETYMSRGKVLAESSPGGIYTDPNWRGATPHEAPPCRGITELYNRGTRARRFWPCLHCGRYFMLREGPAAFALPPFEELLERVQAEPLELLAQRYARVPCAECGALHQMTDREQMRPRGVWVHEGQHIDVDGQVVGPRRTTPIASFWLGPAAAGYQRWDALLLKYLQAVLTFARTSDEQPLKNTTQADLAACYLPRAIAERRSAEELMRRREEWPRGRVPAGVRFLTAQIDVQGNRFVVQVDGWGVGLERWLIDRFVITSSHRPEGDRTAALDPAAFLEDWRVLIPEVIERRYALAARPEVSLPIRLTVCDSGGKAGVTEKAYQFWRELRSRGMGERLMLVKGDPRPQAPRAKMAWPDSTERRDRHAGGRGDVPVWMLNVNVLKDGIAGDLARDVCGPGYVHLPMWVGQDFFDELMVETRTDRGWVKPQGARNEAFDLMVYGRAAVIMLRAENINWDSPPMWALDPMHAAPDAAPSAPSPAPAAPTPAGGGAYLGRRKGYLGGR